MSSQVPLQQPTKRYAALWCALWGARGFARRIPRRVRARSWRPEALAAGVLGLLGSLWLPLAAATGADVKAGQAAVRQGCSGCHRETAPGHFDRISDIRETPEGWSITIFRMRQAHGLQLDDAARDAIIRYLAAANGLAPSESAAGRFALERRPNVQDIKVDEDLRVICARCHSMARTALQRRPEAQWLKLVHMHVGQWPTLEYQESGRNRYWWQSATTDIPGRLARMYPPDSPAWRAWKAHAPTSLAGRWLVRGHVPGRGDYYGTAQIERAAADEYRASYALHYTDGAELKGSSHAIVYTGYEWRGTGTLGKDEVREVFAASEDGREIRGRWFLGEHAEQGGDWIAVRAAGTPAVLAVVPQALRTGASQDVHVIGRGLAGGASFGPGTHSQVIARDPAGWTVRVKVDAQAAPGYRDVSVGPARGHQLFAVYDRVARLEVQPAYGIARVGGGKLAAVPAQFEALGYLSATDAAGHTSDIPLGVLPARWRVEAWDAQAAAAKDVQFAGEMDAATGRFAPAGAGPNPKREFSGNNVGNLAVIASLEDAAAGEPGGKGHLIVTVQRWNTPPIY